MNKTTVFSIKRRLSSKAWKKKHIDDVKALAGPRYSPQLHVELPLSEVFNGLLRTKGFFKRVRHLKRQLSKAFHHLDFKETGLEPKHIKPIEKAVGQLKETLSKIEKYDVDIIPWAKVTKEVRKLDLAIKSVSDRLNQLRATAEKENPLSHLYSSHSSPFENQLWTLIQLRNNVSDVNSFAVGNSAVLSNRPCLILNGEAGSGKTHFLCETISKHLNENKASAVLVFGENVVGSNGIWEAVARSIDIPIETEPETILEALEAAACHGNGRTILVFDAVNETADPKIWQKSLANLVQAIRHRRNIALVLTIRSGFERAVLRTRDEKHFLTISHSGFRGREWEAVTKYFSEFKIPLPEIPILSPEFTNPLFLLLFCKAFTKRAGTKKAAFKGHEGTTYIFEHYVKKMADKIAKIFSLPKGRSGDGEGYVIWDTVMEPIAEVMVDTQSPSIMPSELKRIIVAQHPGIDTEKFIAALESNILLVKIPHYTSEYKLSGFAYRFPFQRFSDHLIARYLFKSFRGSGMKCARIFFKENSKWGCYLKDWQNIGVVEALAIQCPEWLNGTELFEIAPYLSNRELARTFISSLIWRKPSAFKQDTRKVNKFVKEHVLQTGNGYGFLDALISVAAINSHPFNIEYLHDRLSRKRMPVRDAIWTMFINDTVGEEQAIDRLLNWFRDHKELNRLPSQVALALGKLLCWLFTSSNRVLRDRATKSFVALLTGRLKVVLEVLQQFESVDDPYVMDRAMASAYGCCLRSDNSGNEFCDLANWVYKKFFENGTPTTHLLIRANARAIVELAHNRHGLSGVDLTKVAPPYGAKWPKSIPPVDQLRKKYDKGTFNDDDMKRGFLAIWSSLMYQNGGAIADFGNYVVGNWTRRWLYQRLDSELVNRNELLTEFMDNLNEKQTSIWKDVLELKQYQQMALLRRELMSYKDDDSQFSDLKQSLQNIQVTDEDIKTTQANFITSLSKKKCRHYEEEIAPYLDENYEVRNQIEEIPSTIAQCWIFQRVVELGWKPELHGAYDKRVQQRRPSRNENRLERIGKKYQWIALHEFLGILADNFKLKDEENYKETSNYQGPWQIGNTRDIDPSCLLDPNRKEWLAGLPEFQGYGPKYMRWDPGSWQNRRIWPKIGDCRIWIDSDCEEWLVLGGFYNWQEFETREDDDWRKPRKLVRIWISSFLTRSEGVDALVRMMRDKSNRRNLPDTSVFYTVFLGEYPESLAYQYENVPYHSRDGWMRGVYRTLPTDILLTDDDYQSTGENSDSSISEAVHVKLPCSWLVTEMHLKQPFADGRFFNSAGGLVAFDPSVYSAEAPSVVLVRKSALDAFLKDRELCLVWHLGGEKLVVGGNIERHFRINIRGQYVFEPEKDLSGNWRTTIEQ